MPEALADVHLMRARLLIDSGEASRAGAEIGRAHV